MIKRYHNKASIRIERRIFDKLRGYIGDGRHRRRKAFAMALLLDDEQYIDGLAAGIIMLIRDNPELIDYILSSGKVSANE